MTDLPEIEPLRRDLAESAIYCDGLALPVGTATAIAEQAVRDAEARVRGRAENGTWPDQSAQHAVLLDQIKDARREAFREAVEALRDEPVGDDFHDAIVFLERRFLTSEGEDDA